MTPWLIWKISGEYPVFAWPEERPQKYLVVGSIIEYATPSTIVWGSGLMSQDDRIDERARILAVRGPITRQRALECGAACPPVLGDPALLLPRLYKPARTAKRALVGVVPHYFDKPKVFAHWEGCEGCKAIDIQQPIERVIDEIASCDFVLSSSLHGLIVAHAYGIPALWIEFSKMLGDGTKFRDYFSSVGESVCEPVNVEIRSFRPKELLPMIPARVPATNTDLLWESCPFRVKS